MRDSRGAALTKAERQEELRQFFCIAAELRNPETPDEKVLDLLDEVEAIYAHTPSKKLRRRCFELLADLFDPDQKQSDALA